MKKCSIVTGSRADEIEKENFQNPFLNIIRESELSYVCDARFSKRLYYDSSKSLLSFGNTRDKVISHMIYVCLKHFIYMKRTVCFTLDVEPDFAGLMTQCMYCGKKDLRKLVEIVKRQNLKLTAFVTGKALEKNPDLLDLLREMRAEIEQHSYSHQVGQGSKVRDIEQGIEVHEKILGRKPLGYRAPEGIISHKEAMLLQDLGILFDSSVFPTFFPGRFNRLTFPLDPFTIKGSKLVEIPFAVIPKIRIPFGLSYMQLLGLSTFKLASRFFDLPRILVFDFHTYELGKVNSYCNLSLSGKIIYYRAQHMYDDPFQVFVKFVDYIIGKGYESKYMIDVYNEAKSSAPVWEWNAH